MSYTSDYQDYPTESQINQKSKNNKDCIVLNIHNNKLPCEMSLASSKPAPPPPSNMTETEANLKIDEKLDDKKTDNSLPRNNINIANNFIYYDNTRENQKNKYPYLPNSEKRGNIIKEEKQIYKNKNKYSKSFNPYKMNEIIQDKSDKDENQNTKEKIIPQKEKNSIEIVDIEKNIKQKKKKSCCECWRGEKNQILRCIFCIIITPISPIAGCFYLCYILSQRIKEKKNNS